MLIMNSKKSYLASSQFTMNGSMIYIAKPSIGPEEIRAVKKVLERGWLGTGPVVQEFENACCDLIGCKYFIGLSSGTKALEIALMVSGSQNGDEVLVPSLTYAATIQSIINLSLKPVFVDSSLQDANMCMDDVENKITTKTRFIMPVHLRGRSCDMDTLNRISEKHNLKIIEDAAHAFASKYHDKFVGQESYLACFSFGPLKNITCGTGGGIATNDESIARFIYNYRNMGLSRSTWDRYDRNSIDSRYPWDYQVTSAGDRCYLSEINAAIGIVQLKRVNEFKNKKKRLIQTYESEFSTFNPVTTLLTDLQRDFLCIYPVLVSKEKREGLMRKLVQKGIHSSIHYPANHLQPYFKKYSNDGLKNATNLCERLITLPLFTELSEDQQAYVIDVVKRFLT